ncbi:MAG TPA: hypothetical protein DCZ95_17215 [Verrucomicrobia bacterium]|nr:MAG: hypothetical protein A2X46_09695 [Lentisphaerae bacterium GWF2_57_35]HBA85825.1 hypothetical protein [Verrucomicrobiota bacterium]
MMLAGLCAVVLAQSPGDDPVHQEAFKLQDAAPDAETPAAAPDRDPFWPIGYAPAPVAKTNAPVVKANAPMVATPTNLDELTPEKMRALKSKITVGGIMKQGAKRYVLVNSQMVTIGDPIQIEFEGNVYRFTIRTLNDQDVTLEPLETQPSSNAQKTGDN